jgi:hypothetical protein
MVFVVLFLAIGVVIALAALLVVREAARLAMEPPPPIFDVEEAYEWVVRHVADDVAATLTPDDVRRILDFQLEFFERQGVAGNGSSHHPKREIVVGVAETVAYILERAASTGDAYLPEQVHAVVDVQMAYLRAIGALSDPAGDA